MAVGGSGVSLIFLVLYSCMAATTFAVTLSSIGKTLLVTASTAPKQVLKAGQDQMTVTWSFNKSFPAGTDSTYKMVKLKLCYGPSSQVDRAWRKTVDNLKKDKTCQFDIVARPYSPNNNSFTWTVDRVVPTATYFVRAYAYNSQDLEVAYGQSTDAHKTTNLFDIQSISGRHVSLDIASVCFSAISVVSLFGFFLLEKRKAKMAQQK